MKLYGEKKRGEEGFEIQDLTIACSIDELDKLIYFLSYARVYLSSTQYYEHDDILKAGGDRVIPHCHYCYWDKQWKEEDFDVIVTTSFKAVVNGDGEIEWVNDEEWLTSEKTL